MAIFPAVQRHRPCAYTNLYCLMTETHVREERLAQGCCRPERAAGGRKSNMRPVDRKSIASQPARHGRHQVEGKQHYVRLVSEMLHNY